MKGLYAWAPAAVGAKDSSRPPLNDQNMEMHVKALDATLLCACLAAGLTMAFAADAPFSAPFTNIRVIAGAGADADALACAPSVR